MTTPTITNEGERPTFDIVQTELNACDIPQKDITDSMSHVPNIHATKIIELHGDWLVVRSKNRKPSTPKNISNNNNNQYSKGNMFKGNNAGKKTNQFAISKQHMQTSYKVDEAHIDREGDGKNKRQR
ncbi:hypothetical protein P8452_76143 [Trifolium repens]|nr:hypothetical protein P8452_76143 [Trifolium repens]